MHESIFISALRSFCKSLGVICGIAVALILITFGVGALSNTLSMPTKSELTISPDANWNRSLLPDTAPVILRINLHGIIGQKDLNEQTFIDMLLDAQSAPLAKGRVKGILLHINSPGGLASTSNEIFRLLKKYKEKYNLPLYAYVNGLCASGGMMIACAADAIYSSPDSTIGSVGVRLGPAFNFSEAMAKVGIQSLTLTQGKDKDFLNPFRPWKEGEDTFLQELMAAEYENFVTIVTDARKNLSREKLVQEYGARVFVATKAAELGFVDNGNADYEEALSALVQAAKIQEAYQVILIEPPSSIFKELSQTKSGLLRGKIEHVFSLDPNIPSEMNDKILHLYQP